MTRQRVEAGVSALRGGSDLGGLKLMRPVLRETGYRGPIPQRFAHSSPATVPSAGLYSHPTQPA